ncbi:hybrid sensor histidine kinase/response regulator [Christiangramia fulva]|uniref:histidine kinase n=2 Tax=Christiangramia fulva TaxID=2126553 RepID=A0A2R3ZB05_9FLAO|nr:hybrid sensor histidine kinase/response regulator [Christiangramia fulva]
MGTHRRSITVKVIAGYLIVAILAAVAVWFIYSQVKQYSEIAQSNSENNKQLILVSEITTDLNQSENISRRLIQTGEEEELDRYKNQIDTIKSKLFKLKAEYQNLALENEVDSITKLLDQKSENLRELDSLRSSERNTNYYSKALRELQNIDASFSDYNYKNRFRNLKPYQRDVLIKLLEYSRKDNAEQLTNQRLDSIVKSVKKVLTELEYANRQFQNEVNRKEIQLLNNDMILNQRLRNLLSDLEIKERQNSMDRAENFQNILQKTADIIIGGGLVIGIIILFFIVNILRDITKSQRYRAQLEEAKQFAESLLVSREQFMAAITHDLRSPLTTVMGYTDLMLKTGVNERQAHYIHQIKKSSEFILRLVNDLLDLSKLEAGKMLVEELPFNPKKLIEDTIGNVIPAEKKKDVKIETSLSAETDVQVKSDPFRIKQILANLLSNAWKFTDEGSIVVSSSLEKKSGNTKILRISVKDSGIGISEEKLESIFEEFSQENSSIEKRFGGSGLGLAITKRLTELMEGEIKVESRQGEGSTFSIFIPVKISEKREEENKPKPSGRKEIQVQGTLGKKALVVDDEPGQLSLSSEICKGMGLKTDTAVNGKLAWGKLQKNQYDIVLTDIQMPVMDGFNLIEKIRQDEKLNHLKVIALSGRKEVKAETYTSAGFDRSLHKPYQPEDLKKVVAELLRLEVKEISEKPQSRKVQKADANYDLSEIFEFSGKDKSAMQTIIQAFLEGAGKGIDELKEAQKSGDKEQLGKIAHRMLPMLRQMSAIHITPTLQKLESHEEVGKSEFESMEESLRSLMKDLEAEITV